jgi:anti-anti-sigma regulatory factor
MSNLSLAALLNAEPVHDGIVVRFNSQDLKEANARQLAEGLFDLAAKGSGPHLDFGEVDSLTRCLMLRLTILDKKLQDLGDRLILLNPQAHVREAIETSRLAGFFSGRY